MNFRLRLWGRFVGTTALTALAFTPTLAADVLPASANWTGFHVGAGAGYGMADHAIDASVFVPPDVLPISDLDFLSILLSYDGVGGKGALGTVEAGFDYQFNNDMLLGIQADITRSNIGTHADVDDVASYSLIASQSFSVMARAGRVFDGSTLAFVTGGWTRTRMDGDLSVADEFTGLVDNSSYDFDLDGISFGGGVETALASNVTAKIEYRYTRFNPLTLVDIPGFVLAESTSDIQTVRAVLSYHMGQVGSYDGGFDTADWTGFHAGIGGGGGMALHAFSGDTEFGGGEFSGIGGKGYFGTVEAGADVQVGERLVLGVGGDYNRSNIATRLDVSAVDEFLGLGASLNAELATKESFSLLARAGILSSPNVLWYGTGGWTRSKIAATLDADDGLGTVISEAPEAEWVDGVTAGAGVEIKLTDRVSLKSEYRLSRYKPEELFAEGVEISSRSFEQSVRTVLSFRF